MVAGTVLRMEQGGFAEGSGQDLASSWNSVNAACIIWWRKAQAFPGSVVNLVWLQKKATLKNLSTVRVRAQEMTPQVFMRCHAECFELKEGQGPSMPPYSDPSLLPPFFLPKCQGLSLKFPRVFKG